MLARVLNAYPVVLGADLATPRWFWKLIDRDTRHPVDYFMRKAPRSISNSDCCTEPVTKRDVQPCTLCFVQWSESPSDLSESWQLYRSLSLLTSASAVRCQLHQLEVLLNTASAYRHVYKRSMLCCCRQPLATVGYISLAELPCPWATCQPGATAEATSLQVQIRGHVQLRFRPSTKTLHKRTEGTTAKPTIGHTKHLSPGGTGPEAPAGCCCCWPNCCSDRPQY